MTIGEGIFWAGLFYLLARAVEIGYAYFMARFPNTQIQRLDHIERVLLENGIERV
ncbi:MAG: hypothetical protein WAZ60_24060 [Desulfosalsimonadaceae bacterium]